MSQNKDQGKPFEIGSDFKWTNVVLISTAGLVLGSSVIEILNITYILPISQCELYWTMSDKGLLSVTAVLGALFGSIFWGSLADIYGRRTILYPTLLLTFLFTSMSSLADSFWTLFVFRFLSGLFISAGASVIVPYLGEFHSTTQRDRAILSSSIILGIICVLLPMVASLVINRDWSVNFPLMNMTYKPWRLFMFISGIPNLITGTLIYFLPESPKFLASLRGQRYEESPTIWRQTSILFTKSHLKLTISISIMFFLAFSLGGMGSWFPEILNSVTTFINENKTESLTICEIFRNRSKTEDDSEKCVEKFELSTYSFAIFSEILFVFLMVSFSFAVRWISKRYLLSLTFFGTGVSILGTILSKNSNLSLYLFSSFVWSRAIIIILAAIIVDEYPIKMRSIATCFANIVGRLSYFLASNYIGFLLQDFCEFAFFVPAIWAGLGAVASFFIPKMGV